MKRHNRIFLGLIVLLLAGSVSVGLWLDPMGLFTIHSIGFNVAKFKEVKEDMRKDQVLGMLGDPMDIVKMEWNQDCPEMWLYSKKNSINLLYRKYTVFFDRDGKVLQASCALDD